MYSEFPNSNARKPIQKKMEREREWCGDSMLRLLAMHFTRERRAFPLTCAHHQAAHSYSALI